MIGLDWMAVILSIIGYFCITRKDCLGFVIWIPANFLWTYIGICNRTYGMVVLFVFYNILNIYGIYLWRRKNK